MMSAERSIESLFHRVIGSMNKWINESMLRLRVLRSSFSDSEEGFSLIEVMVAMVILAFGLLGAMALFQIADHGLRDGGQGLRALALVQSRLEAKRAAPWNQLLLDDVNADGIVDVTMRDDGTQGDLQGGDGAYTATVEQAGIALLWTVRADRAGSLDRVGAVVVEARATYLLPSGRRRTLFLATIRANPNYVGERA
ncbi:MAG: prepilin-type N-terminal cleavage/methylation domain-containing protein [Nitrospira sp.]|nr:MAG: prepilin-type N-terminal cleavage/methylation domain-containing protein [Nitrospira sp.]